MPAIDSNSRPKHQSAMADPIFPLKPGQPRVVASFGNHADLAEAVPAAVRGVCDLAEVRLDLLLSAIPATGTMPWAHLAGIPVLFTARRAEEGGAGNLNAAERSALLATVLDEAACIDIEVASIGEMAEILDEIRARGIPWIASFHDFEKLPPTRTLEDAASKALAAGAGAFKAAARLHHPADVARLAEFQLAEHGLPVATMGMGPLAPMSRLLCAQCGSVLNYGFVGKHPTAPGQWSAGLLNEAIRALTPFRQEQEP